MPMRRVRARFDLPLDRLALMRQLTVETHNRTAHPQEALASQDVLDLAAKLRALDCWYEDELR